VNIFSYEVSRSLAACEGALLVVDAAQGVEAQTISNLYLAIEAGPEIIPVLNKIDLPSAMPDTVKAQIVDLIGCDESEIIEASAKTRVGINEILEAIVKKIPPPKGDENAPLQALIFDSVFDAYRGAIAYIRIFNGSIKEKEPIRFFAHDKYYEAEEIGILRLARVRTKELKTGDVGYLISGAKEVHDMKVGDTITHVKGGSDKPLPGYKEIKPMVYSGLFPVNSDEFEDLRDALEKFRLNDSSLVYTPETSAALGFGFRCGFLGMLHMEIVQERLEREFNQSIVTTLPNVEYVVYTKKEKKIIVDNPSDMPEAGDIERVEEPYVKAQILKNAGDAGNGWYGELLITVLGTLDILGSYQRLDKDPKSGILHLTTNVMPDGMPYVFRAGYDKINIQDEADIFKLDDRSYLFAEFGYKPLPYLIVSLVYHWTFTPVRDVDDNVIDYEPQKKIEPRVSFIYPLDF